MTRTKRKPLLDDTPLVLLPGTLCDERVFAPLLTRLPAVQSSIILTEVASSIRDTAEMILTKAPPAFALLGFSLGGIVAMEVALRAPSRVMGLALLQTTPLPVPVASHANRRAAVAHARQLGLGRYVREFLWPDYRGDVPSPSVCPLLEDMAERTGLAGFAQQVEMAVTRADYRVLLKDVACPVLLVSGDADKVCPREAVQALEEALPFCIQVVVPRAGHMALLESPDEVAEAVAAWFHTVMQHQADKQRVACEDGAGGNV